MATFTWNPAPGASMACKPTVDTTKYGDGYEQRVGIAINSQAEKWSVKFVQYIPEVLAFVKARNGEEAFNWTNPLGVAGVYKCAEWKVNHVGGNVFDLSCDFEQVFEVVSP